MNVRHFIVVIALTLTVSMVIGHAANLSWEGNANGNWTNDRTNTATTPPGRWNDSFHPGENAAGDQALINSGYVVTLNTPLTYSTGKVEVGKGGSGSGLIIEDGAAITIDSGFIVGSKVQASVTQTGGSVTIINDFHKLQIGAGGDDNGDGLYTISGGSIQITGATYANNIEIASGDSYSAEGELHVIGTGPSLISTGANINLDSGGTLRFTIQDASGVTPVHADGSLVLLGGVINVELDGYAPAEGDTFVLATMSDESVTGSLADYLAVEDSLSWGLGLQGEAGERSLTATYLIPEPASFVVFGLGSLVLLKRRNSRFST